MKLFKTTAFIIFLAVIMLFCPFAFFTRNAYCEEASPLIMRRLSEMYGGDSSGKKKSYAASPDGGAVVVKALTDESDSGDLTALNEINKKKNKLVHIAIEVVEIRNNKSRQLGVKWIDEMSVGEIAYKVGERVPEEMTDVPALFGIGEFARWTSIKADIKFLLSKGAARVLAKPKLIAKSETNAFFTVGGLVPVPSASALGQTSIEWKEYGTRVVLLPTVLNESQIGLSIFADVSDLDSSKGAVYSGMNIPGIITRKTSSSVILRDGETLAVAGLEKNFMEETSLGIPILSDIPLIGHLFSRKDYTDEKSTVVIFVTPTIVKEGVPTDKIK